ncbi:MAG: bifunctional demethylmenaquinone methyltransferase/2-methoxy-6-polyprenyl-1,4-benzoquinol methylase UbiE [Desulfotomaculaceae bacterium]|nr:bifunctional demethylmenaquinone methyltransferase/2-methoxy-6-polyprenyl-1,4-benzoquinol methylase UbiE [Desulfotomaculaceae bacterium]
MTNLPGRENKAKYVQDTFNSIAKNYDLLNTLMSLGLDQSWRRLAVKRSELKEGGTGLDVCCGTGMLTMEQARAAGSAGKITGLDFSENMIAVARQNVKEFSFKDSIRFVQGDAMSLPFNDNEFDCATVGWGLRNVPDILTAVQEMVRVIKPGGKVVSLDMAQPVIPVFRELYWLCFNSVIPALGKLISGNRMAYAYLHDSAKAFVHQKELAAIFSQAGLAETRYLNLYGGVVAIVEGRKPV